LLDRKGSIFTFSVAKSFIQLAIESDRRDSLAVCCATAREWPLKNFVQVVSEAYLSFWKPVFAAVSNAPDVKRYNHEIYLHRVLEPMGGGVKGDLPTLVLLCRQPGCKSLRGTQGATFSVSMGFWAAVSARFA
jgi:hypothetical protein